ncbi:cell filamentation protein Fic [Pedobacter ginsengisoli]|uniref:Cell filamentation protein Fic n=1 Tax=Pedobacter ginsengisoli TaxID=363852 RepID=A0A2D1U5C6_9SPHI|nr:Fic family protein [Pedobacter ginsengisoli]ATP56811.1 cell filamentation protein Fic [Pedobacter ginsengisoli]
MKYNWELPDWPNFKVQLNKTEALLYEFALKTGEVNGILQTLPQNIQQEALLQIMISEAVKTSEIEGEFLSRQEVMSSIRNNLGLNIPSDIVHDRRAAGIGKLMIDVRNSFNNPLTKETIWEWHIALLGSSNRITIGAWRKGDEPMQVISGRIGNEIAHFEAPPSNRVPNEMEYFIDWFNETAPGGSREINSAPVRSAIAHLYFESIHPLEDGNGRIGRAIAEKALSQTLGRPVLLSLSETIEMDRPAYYAALKKAQQNNDISEWVNYFVSVTLTAQLKAKALVNFTLQKTRFFDKYKERLNSRQHKAIMKMLEMGIEGFKGGMTAKKYMSITKTSKATATRDLQVLSDLEILIAKGSGRSVHYDLNLKLI